MQVSGERGRKVREGQDEARLRGRGALAFAALRKGEGQVRSRRGYACLIGQACVGARA